MVFLLQTIPFTYTMFWIFKRFSIWRERSFLLAIISGLIVLCCSLLAFRIARFELWLKHMIVLHQTLLYLFYLVYLGLLFTMGIYLMWQGIHVFVFRFYISIFIILKL